MVKTFSLVNCATLSNGDEAFCNCNTCSKNEGDCDYHYHCYHGLACGSNNCPASISFDSEVDCTDSCGTPSSKGDSYCNDENNNCGCEWDGGDCCGDNVVTTYCSACECLGRNDFLRIHNGGSYDSEMVAMLTGQMNDTKISISGNQMFVVFKTNHEIVAKGFHALIMESKYFDENKKLHMFSLNTLITIS